MSRRIIYALSLLIAGTIGIGLGFAGIAGIEAAMMALIVLVCVANICGGIYALGGAIVILTHETALGNWLKERFE